MTQSIQHRDTKSEGRNHCVNRCFSQQDLVTSCTRQERQACHVLRVHPFIDSSPLDSFVDRLGNVKVVRVNRVHQHLHILYLNFRTISAKLLTTAGHSKPFLTLYSCASVLCCLKSCMENTRGKGHLTVLQGELESGVGRDLFHDRNLSVTTQKSDLRSWPCKDLSFHQ